MKRQCGFTLLELMIVVSVVAILAGVALPAYQQFMLRGKVAGATQLLQQQKTTLEGFYNANRTYGTTATGIASPCAQKPKTEDGFFELVCATTNAGQRFTWTATSADGAFIYTINEANVRTTIGTPKGFTTTTQNCWITKRGQTC